MNPKFHQLPVEKQQRILQAGYRVFAQNTYKNAPMSAIADAAGISKSLLFHYFRNKKTFYMDLFEHAVRYLSNQKPSLDEGSTTDFFDLILDEIRRRVAQIAQMPYLYQFLTKAYYETDPQVALDITQWTGQQIQQEKSRLMDHIDRTVFRHPQDVEILYDIIITFSEGLMLNYQHHVAEHIDLIQQQATAMIENLRRNYTH